MNNNKREHFEKSFIKPIIRWGMLTNMLAFILSFMPAFYLIIFHDARPSIANIIGASITIIVGFAGPLWVIEPMAFFPILGIPGSYIANVSGNIANLRIPCSTMAQEAASVEQASVEGSIISTLGVGISVVINLLAMVLGVIVGAKIVAFFPPAIYTAFQQFIMPAVYGGVFVSFGMKNWKAGVVTIIATTVLTYFFNWPSFILMPLSIAIAIYAGIYFYNKEKKKISAEDGGVM